MKDPKEQYVICPWCKTIQETEIGRDWENLPTRVISRHHGNHMSGQCIDQPEAYWGSKPTEWDWFLDQWNDVGMTHYFNCKMEIV